jgi:hypothetical protein
VRAASKAQKRGISIVTSDELREPGLRHSFDVVVSIDVVEHVSGLSVLRSLFSDSLRAAGILLLMTGNVDSRAAQRAGRYWYYHQYAEHISFLGERSARVWLEPDFEEVFFREIIHYPLSLVEQFKCLAKFPVALTLEKVGLIQHLKKYPKLYPVHDHFLITARRRPSNGGVGK